jgi:hypothetical protein
MRWQVLRSFQIFWMEKLLARLGRLRALTTPSVRHLDWR